MFCASSGQIVLTAGDTGVIGFEAAEGGYIPTENDRAIFTVRDKVGGRRLIEKTVQPDAQSVTRVPFMAEDTAKLKPRGYVWDIRFALEAKEDMWPPRSRSFLEARSTIITAFQRMMERIRFSSSLSPG